MKGAPIRFVVAVLGGWTCIRIAVMLPGDSPLGLAADVLSPPAAAAGRTEERRPPPASPSTARPALPGVEPLTRRPARSVANHATPHADVATARERPAPPGGAGEIVQDVAPAVLVPPNLGSPPEQEQRRLAVGAWVLARGGADGTLSGGMLGGSQAGVRVTYAVDARRRVALSARAVAPLQGRGREAAVGIDWQPVHAPVHLLVEQRFGLDGTHGGPSVIAIAGLNPTPVAAGFHLEAYAQGGAIEREGRVEAFGDGAARLTRPVLAIGGALLDAGAGAWAAGQRGAARVDAGPTVGMALPIAGRRVRISADWRQRLAGRARPESGPALSIGTDF